ncbi:hypothetical protein MNBD_ALPHA08-322 [hydrothermal vent metagenome]|uniref:Uncharacterized protein n=1 Tax=hydrothermal vent metagenome TaxID=652676 RepID=A0A3B0SY44_9ZZZZ
MTSLKLRPGSNIPKKNKSIQEVHSENAWFVVFNLDFTYDRVNPNAV